MSSLSLEAADKVKTIYPQRANWQTENESVHGTHQLHYTYIICVWENDKGPGIGFLDKKKNNNIGQTSSGQAFYAKNVQQIYYKTRCAMAADLWFVDCRRSRARSSRLWPTKKISDGDKFTSSRKWSQRVAEIIEWDISFCWIAPNCAISLCSRSDPSDLVAIQDFLNFDTSTDRHGILFSRAKNKCKRMKKKIQWQNRNKAHETSR